MFFKCEFKTMVPVIFVTLVLEAQFLEWKASKVTFNWHHSLYFYCTDEDDDEDDDE